MNIKLNYQPTSQRLSVRRKSDLEVALENYLGAVRNWQDAVIKFVGGK